jgi:chromosome segregation ATPase
LQYISDRRGEVADLRKHIESLLSTAGKTQDTISAIEARRHNVEEVHAKTTMISNLLGDVRVNLESVAEQKAVVDHIVDRLAKLESVMLEAQNTLRMLNQERELAERIEKSIKQLRVGGGAEEGRQLA